MCFTENFRAGKWIFRNREKISEGMALVGSGATGDDVDIFRGVKR